MSASSLWHSRCLLQTVARPLQCRIQSFIRKTDHYENECNLYRLFIIPLTLVFFPCSKIEYPVVWSVDEFCDGFFKLIDHLELDRVSIVEMGSCEALSFDIKAHLESS